MLTEVRVPAVSENVKSGKVVGVLVSAGDTVAVDQSLIELETDKAVVEIPSPFAGRVAEIAVETGQTVAVGAVIVRLETAGAGSAASPAGPAAPATSAPAAVPAPAPPAAAAPPPATPAPATPEPVAPVPVAPASGAPASARPSDEEAGPLPDGTPVPASPSVRRLARELGVDVERVRGTGPAGRITEDDVKGHARALVEGAAAPGAGSPGAAFAPRPLPDFAQWGPVRREALSRVREVTAETMAWAWATVPQVTQNDRADVTDLENYRREYAAAHPDARLTMTAILVKVAAAALRAFPRFNTSLDAPRRELIFKDYIHVAVAVDTEHGLLVPVVRDADRKGILRIATELSELAARARTRKIAPADLEGGTFSISNLGGIGGSSFSPIVYSPQVAILGVSRATTEPVWRDGAFVPRLLLPLSLTYDHRVIDGADGARFLRWICEALRQPLSMLMTG